MMMLFLVLDIFYFFCNRNYIFVCLLGFEGLMIDVGLLWMVFLVGLDLVGGE